jgi:hypothetical protein
MNTDIVKIYTSVAGGMINAFTVQVGDGTFVLSPTPPDGATLDFISRVDFFDRDGNLLLVVPTYPTTSTIAVADGGQIIRFRLQLRNFLGGPQTIPFATDLSFYQRQVSDINDPVYPVHVAPCLPDRDDNPEPGFLLGAKDTNPGLPAWEGTLVYYATVFHSLPGFDSFNDSYTVPALDANPAVSGRPLYSDHVSVLVRRLRTADDGDPLPVLCPRRAYQTGPGEGGNVMLPYPFYFPLPVVHDEDAAAHLSQFPQISWFTLPTADQTLREADIWHFETSAIPFDNVKQLWSEQVLKPYAMGLRLTNAQMAISLAAYISWDATADGTDTTWRLLRTVSLKPTLRNGNPWLIALSERLLPGGYLDSDTWKAEPASWKVSGEFPGFRTHDGRPLKFSAVMPPFANAHLTDNDEQPKSKPPVPLKPLSSMLFRLTRVSLQSAPPARVRLGSLDLTMGYWSPPDLQKNQGIDTLIFEVDFDPPLLPASLYNDPLNPGSYMPRLYVQGTLPLAGYAPGAQDELPNDNEFQITPGPGADSNRAKFVRSAPIVIDANLIGAAPPATSLMPATCRMKFDERTLPSPQRQQLVLNLQLLPGVESNAHTPRVLVLDREPFLVAFVSLQPPATGTANPDPTIANNIGVWCNLYPEGPGWRLQAGSNGFNLYLPPQVVGEGMVRGFLADDAPAGTRPSPETALIDYRFSTLMFARLHANYSAQNAVEPGWNTRRVLEGTGQQLAGALLDDQNGGATFELYYGMTTSVAQPNLRLSEIFSRLGNFPGPLPDPSDQGGFAVPFSTAQSIAYGHASDDWASLYAQLLRRLAVLELWDDHQGPDLVIDEKVDFTLRLQALQDTPGFYSSLHYAIDSDNITAELSAATKSVAGQLNSPRFTALGGYGSQRAEFANGKVIIDTRTSMGRIESLTITLVGRVGNLWNHALHVTVFARTVLPSDQFALYQDALYNRPLLRKTEEYVLITEATRAYPESGAADPALAGFVLGTTFKSTKINVDSRWGGDVGKFGWQVPLWQPGALPEIVYPKPHIAFKVAVDPATGTSAVLGEVDDPQKLCFYTDTQTTTTSDTDSWGVVSEIDWVDQPATPPDGTGAAFQDPSIEPGFGRFTYHFADAPTQVNIVAQRTTTAVAATLSNVSMMRGQRSAAVDETNITVQQRVRRISDWWTSARTHLERAADEADTLPNNAIGGIKTRASKKLTDSLNAVQQTYLGNPTAKSVAADLTRIANAPAAACDAVKSRLSSALNRVDGQKQNVLQTVLVGFPDELRASLNHARATATPGGDPLEIAAAADSAIDSAVNRFQSTIAPATGAPLHIAAVIDSYVAALNQFLTAVTNTKTAIDALKPAQPGQNAIAAALKAIQDIMPTTAAAPGKQGTSRAVLNREASQVVVAADLFTGGRGTQLVLSIDGALDAYLQQLSLWLAPVDDRYRNLTQPASILLGTVASTIQSVATACGAASQQMRQLATQQPFPLITTFATSLKQQIDDAAKVSLVAVNQAINDCVDTYLSTVSGPATWANSFLQQQENWITTNSSALCNTFTQDVTTLLHNLGSLALTEFNSLMQQFINGPDGLVADTAAFRNALANISGQFENQLQQAARGLTQEVQTITSGATGAALRVIRAFGDPPHVPTMDFVVPQIALPNLGDIGLPAMAYNFTDALHTVDMTPARAVVQQVADGLSSLSQLGVHLPTRQLLDRLLPDSLQNFDFTSILPHFAGIDLTSLLSGIRMPSVANDNVKITHHVDPQGRRASLDAAIQIPLAGNSTLFDLGPVELRLLDAEFTAQVHCAVVVGQQVQQTSAGQITGDWELLICGMTIVTFTKTTLSFDSSGKVHFDIKAPNVRLAEVLQFVADLVNSFNLGVGGFTLHMTASPVAVQCILDLPLPDMSGGAFGIQNLRLGAVFELGYDHSFYLSVAANLARETAPFILTIFVLGGAGWIEAAVRYQDGEVTGLITIGMAASASLAISLGPISGSVSIQFGIFARLAIGTGGGFQLGVMLLIDGRVNLLGFIDANIMLLLEAEYTPGGGLTGRGVFSISIKICWCFTLEVHTGVEYTFGGAGGSTKTQTQVAARPAIGANAMLAGAPDSDPPPTDTDDYENYRDAAVQYVTMLA